jgi:ATP-dependent DNA helicase PIF1
MSKLTEQQIIKELILKKKNICITGSAGTGKSFLLRELITILQTKYGKNKVGITSTTGTGATVIGGTTLSSFLGLKSDSHLDKDVIFNRIINSNSDYVLKNWKRTKVLIIDEVSMLDSETFDKLENLARDFRMNNFPFGKMQLILVGDFCQLPPVGNNAGYCFEAQTWNKCISQTINLTQIYRQKDNWFISYLEDIRLGYLSQYRWENLLSWKQKEPKWPQDGIKPVNLFATKQEANGINEQELAKLESESHFFVAEIWEWKRGKLEELIKSCLAVEKLELKVGTQVMLIFNWHEMRLVNGSQGIVIGFTDYGRYWPIVKFTDGRELVIKKHCWEKIEGYDENGNPNVFATYSQIPLVLSWAMTIHKSQGQTIERLRVDLSKCFMPGQIYTALSRCSNPQYLQIINFPRNRLWCSKKVRNYYQELNNSERVLTEKYCNSQHLNNQWTTK